MSKGGAGKVYFVLYLAVILELLIIIVERDEAEEHLMKKQQESMRIVESILTQLQSGAGTEGINTRPQDAIVLSDNLPDDQKKLFKKFRTYFIEVGVTDVTSAVNTEGMDDAQKKEKIETLKKLANVQELQYEVYYHPSKEVEVPDSPPASEFKKAEKSPQAGMKLANSPNAISTEMWELKATRKLVLDIKSMADYQKPVYNESDNKTGDMNEFAPDDSARVNRIFGYSQDKTDKLRQNGKLTKRAFVCNFEPPTQPGWYKLRFSSQTNRIMGISADQKFNALKDDQKVNIGTVQLKVKDLKSVQRQLAEQLAGTGIPSADAFANGTMDIDKFNDGLDAAKKKAVENQSSEKTSQSVSRIDLYGYIAKLLSPGKYTSFDQNRGSIEIDIYVQKPELDQEQPIITWDANGDLYSFDKANRYVATFTANLYDKVTPTVKFSGGPVTVKKLESTSSSGKVGRYKVEFVGSLPPNRYQFTASMTAAGKEETKVLNYEIFQTGLVGDTISIGTEKSITSGDESLINELNYAKGDAIDFSVIPLSYQKIPQNQFRIIIDGVKKKNSEKSESPESIIGLRVTENAGYLIPFDAEKIGVKIVWIDPVDQQAVQIFPTDGTGSYEFKPTVRRPVITSMQDGAIQISNPKNPVFTVEFTVKVAQPGKVQQPRIELKGQAIGKYKVVPVGEPAKSEDKYTQSYKLVGKLPLKKGTSGTIDVYVSATAIMPNGEVSIPRGEDFNFTILY